MASFGPDDTGVRHGPRVKVAIDPPLHFSADGDNASVKFDGTVAVGDVPARLLKQVQAFIELNRPVLTEYWEERISTGELVRRLRPIGQP